MKLPKILQRFCRKCNTHTEHKVALAKKKTAGTAHPLGRGSKVRMRRRGEARGSGNIGRLSRGSMNTWKRFNKKQSKKPDLRFTCKDCNKTSTKKKNKRAKKIELE